MLREGEMTISEIATQCGFSSASHFIRTFRKAFGITPASYRKMGNE